MKQNFFLSISEFASIFGVTRRSLIYYDKLDIFKPHHIDPYNDYRYYSLNQLDEFDFILYLKKIGFTLDEIKKYNVEKSSTKFFDLMSKHSDDVLKNLTSLKLRLQSIIYAIEDYQKFSQSHLEHPQIQSLDQPLPICSVSCHALSNKAQIYKHLYKNKPGIFCSGIGETKSCQKILQNDFSSESIFYINFDLKTSNDVLPSGSYLTYYHVGSYSGISSALLKIISFSEKEKLTIADDIYMYGIIGQHCTNDTSKFVTKLFAKIL